MNGLVATVHNSPVLQVAAMSAVYNVDSLKYLGFFMTTSADLANFWAMNTTCAFLNSTLAEIALLLILATGRRRRSR